MHFLRGGDLEKAISLYREVLSVDPDNCDVLHLLGSCLHQRAQFQPARVLFERAVKLRPADARLHYALGRTHKEQHNFEEALGCYRQSLALAPDSLEVLVSLAVATRHAGNAQEALELLEKARQSSPESAEVAANLGTTLLQLGRHEEALVELRRAAALRPDLAEAHNNLGLALLQLGQNNEEEALDCFQRAIDLRPNYTEALMNAGALLRKRGALKTAATCFSAAADSDYIARFSLGQILFDLADAEGALRCFDRIIEIVPEEEGAHVWRGMVLQSQGQLQLAIEAFEKAAACNPKSVEGLAGKAGVSLILGDYEHAMEALEQGLARMPDDPSLLNLRGNLALASGCVDDALKWYKRSLIAAPLYADPAGNSLFVSCYSDQIDVEELFQAHRAWGLQQPEESTPPARRRAQVVTGRRVRIGLVSPDLNHHSVAFFLEPILAGLDRSQFDVFCYYNTRRVDEVTTRLSAHAQGWRWSAGLSDDLLAQWVVKDAVDILIDVAGHTANNRLSLFRLRPAPIQVTYLGYPTTTGLDAIDFRISDWVVDPAGYEELNTERVVRLDGSYFCYRPSRGAPDPVDPPATYSGRITFGSFNNPAKLSASSVKLWASVLNAVPGSTLLLKHKALTHPSVRRRFTDMFADHGIGAEQILCTEWEPQPKTHLSTYEKVDIALDTYPYNGATTTCEALWMGVPVVTLMGRAHASRMGASILRAAGLEDMVAVDEDQYVGRCAVLAADLAQLIDLRRNMRTRLQHSRLMDEAQFVRGFEAALLSMLGESAQTSG